MTAECNIWKLVYCVFCEALDLAIFSWCWEDFLSFSCSLVEIKLKVFWRYTVLVVRSEHLIPVLKVFTCISHVLSTPHCARFFTFFILGRKLCLVVCLALLCFGVTHEAIYFLFSSQQSAVSLNWIINIKVKVLSCQLLRYEFTTYVIKLLFLVEFVEELMSVNCFFCFLHLVIKSLALLPTQWLSTWR